MTGFRPVNADHSITNVTFALEFDEILSPAVIDGLLADAGRGAVPWADALPAAGAVQVFLAGPAGAGVHKGAQFSFLRPNGQPAWLLRVAGQEIRVECSQYTRWDKVWDAARDYLSSAFGYCVTHQPELSPARLVLQVTDQFVGAPAGYDVSALLARDPILGDVPFTSGDLWHVNLGWFEPLKWGRCLHNLVVSSSGEVGSEELYPEISEPFSISIFHSQQLFLGEGDRVEMIDDAMAYLHQSNKVYLQRILNEDVLRQIGLLAKVG